MCARIFVFLFVFGLFNSSFASAEGYEELPPISLFADKYSKTGDNTYLLNAQVRCAAVLFNLANVFKTSGMDDQANMIEMLTMSQMMGAEEAYLSKVIDADDQDRKRARSYVQEEVQRFNLMVGNRMKRNQDQTGEAFSEDDVLMRDITFCAQFSQQ